MPERKTKTEANLMTQFTYEQLLKEAEAARRNTKQSLLDIGDAAGVASDWHDNPAFDYANMRHDVNSLQLSGIEAKLKNIEIIKPNRNTTKVGIGNTVLVTYFDEPEPENYTILGPSDSKRKDGWISFSSPLGASLMGKKRGDRASFQVEEHNRKIDIEVTIVDILPGNF